MSLDSFIKDFGGITEKYEFYNGEVELRYDVENHEYLLVKDGQLIPVPGVTTVCHVIDKSNALIPWACKMMAEKLFSTVPKQEIYDNGFVNSQVNLPWIELETLINAAKSAHKEKLEEAADVGHIAHNWLEDYIKTDLGVGRYDFDVNIYPEDERAANCCYAALKWMKDHNVRWLSTERKIYSRSYQFAGTMDGLAIVDSCNNPLCCQAEFKDHKCVIDWKSSNYLYIEYLLQTAAYQHAYQEETKEHIDGRWVIRLGKTDGDFEPWYLPKDCYETDRAAFLQALALYNSVNYLEDRMNVKKRWIKDQLKAKKQQEKEAQLKIACKSSGKYKGIRKPTCNGGEGCETCNRIYAERQANKSLTNSVE